jgi:ADP-ribosylglycohydrolase
VAAGSRRGIRRAGSCGNGATTRVTPLGAYHPERPTVAAEEAIESAEVAHAHPEGVAGAVLVAVAAVHAGARLDGAPAASGDGP